MLTLTVVDAFTDVPYAGNPAAVALLDAFLPDARLQAIAAEMNLSETAFLVGRERDTYSLRWFSPTTEVDLCGHATLAAAHVLGRPTTFATKSGELRCSVAPDGFIELDFPADHLDNAPLPDGAVDGARSFGRGKHFGLLELEDAAAVRAFCPDPTLPARLSCPALILSAPGDRPGIDCVSRVFAPDLGIPEDPVTGSAHCLLATFWGERLRRDELIGEQASFRGGIVGMRRRGDRVVLRGKAVTVARTELIFD